MMSRPTPEDVEDFLRDTYDRDSDFWAEEETDMETERDLCDVIREDDEARLENLAALHLTVGVYDPTMAFLATSQHACVCSAEGMELIAVTGPAGDRESEWHADLFSAAPALLEAAQTALVMLENAERNGATAATAAVFQLRHAIQKALGKANPRPAPGEPWPDPFADD